MSETEPKFQSTLASMSADSRILLNRILKTKLGDRISYSEFETLVGYDVSPRSTGYNVLKRARDLAERDGIFFSAVRNDKEFHGLMRIDHETLVDSSVNVIHGIRKRATKQLKRLAAVTFDELGRDAQITWNARFSHLQAIRQFSAPKVVRQVEIACEQSAERIDATAILAMFSKKNASGGESRS